MALNVYLYLAVQRMVKRYTGLKSYGDFERKWRVMSTQEINLRFILACVWINVWFPDGVIATDRTKHYSHNITYMLISVMSLIYGTSFCGEWYLSRYFTLTVCSCLTILPFCFKRRIDAFILCRWVENYCKTTIFKIWVRWLIKLQSLFCHYAIFNDLPH